MARNPVQIQKAEFSPRVADGPSVRQAKSVNAVDARTPIALGSSRAASELGAFLTRMPVATHKLAVLS